MKFKKNKNIDIQGLMIKSILGEISPEEDIVLHENLENNNELNKEFDFLQSIYKHSYKSTEGKKVDIEEAKQQFHQHFSDGKETELWPDGLPNDLLQKQKKKQKLYAEEHGDNQSGENSTQHKKNNTTLIAIISVALIILAIVLFFALPL